MRWATVLAVAEVATVAACTRQPESPGASFSIGSAGANFQLTAVDAHPLPATAYFGVDVSVRAMGGGLALAGDHGYTLRVAYVRHFASGNREETFTQSEQGTWRASGNELTLTPASGAAHKATIAGNQLSMLLTVEDSSPPERATKAYAFARAP